MLKKNLAEMIKRAQHDARTNYVRARYSEECVRFLAIRYGKSPAWVKLHCLPIIRETFRPPSHWVSTSTFPMNVQKVLIHYRVIRRLWKGRAYYHPLHVEVATKHAGSWDKSKNRLSPQERKAHFPALPDVETYPYPKGQAARAGEPSPGAQPVHRGRLKKGTKAHPKQKAADHAA